MPRYPGGASCDYFAWLLSIVRRARSRLMRASRIVGEAASAVSELGIMQLEPAAGRAALGSRSVARTNVAASAGHLPTRDRRTGRDLVIAAYKHWSARALVRFPIRPKVLKGVLLPGMLKHLIKNYR